MYILMNERMYHRSGSLAVIALDKPLETLEEAIQERDRFRSEGFHDAQVFALVKEGAGAPPNQNAKETPENQQ